MFRYLILGLLRNGARLHGYALVKEYRERSGIEVSTGNFYRELQRLIVDGLIRSASNPPDADARRTPYEITELGISVFDDWFTAPDAAGGIIPEEDIPVLAEIGVAKVFTPGAPTHEITDWVAEHFAVGA